MEEDQALSDGMKKIFDAAELYRKKEFKDKLEMAERVKLSKYKDEIYEIGDEVLFQKKDNKEWLGPGKVTKYRSNEVEVSTEEGLKRIHPSRIARFYPDQEEDETNIGFQKLDHDSDVSEKEENLKESGMMTRGKKSKV